MEDFLDWSYEVDNYLDMLKVHENKQAKYIAYKLRGGAMAWWDTVQNDQIVLGKTSIQTWRKM